MNVGDVVVEVLASLIVIVCGVSLRTTFDLNPSLFDSSICTLHPRILLLELDGGHPTSTST